MLDCKGRHPKSGERKGGNKDRAQVKSDEIAPSLVWPGEAETHDHKFLKN